MISRTLIGATCPKCGSSLFREEITRPEFGHAVVESCMNGHDRYVKVVEGKEEA